MKPGPMATAHGARAGLSLKSVIIEAEAQDIYSLPPALPLLPQIGWADSETGEGWLALGEADSLVALEATETWGLPDRARERLRMVQGPPEARGMLRYFGGMPFDPSAGGHPEWPAGGGGRFVLPSILVRQQPGRRAQIVITTTAGTGPDGSGRDHDLRSQVEDLTRWMARSPAPTAALRLHSIESAGARMRWDAAVREALERIGAGALQKIVLSRDLLFEGSTSIEPWSIVRRMRACAPWRFQFCFRFDPESAFVGATPERLVAQQGRALACDCIAGTTARGLSEAEDVVLGKVLLASEKELREHRLVLDAILSALQPLTLRLESPALPSLLRLPKILHLHTPVRGYLRAEVHLEDLIARLHPTPAVGGWPRADALRLIPELEGRARGWYAGPVGWVSLDQADFAVAIRSAILRGRSVTVIGGAGIVQGSDPAPEWDETASKAASLLSLFAEVPG